MIPWPLLIATLEGGTEEVPVLLGRSLLRRAAHSVASAGRSTGHIAAIGTRATGHVAATAGRAIGHAAASVGRIAEREAKRIIRRIARPMVAAALHGDEAAIFGADDPQSAAAFLRQKRSALIDGITVAATGAVAASGVGAPAAPAVPVLLPPILDSLIDEVAAKGKEILLGPDPSPDGNATIGSGSPTAANALNASLARTYLLPGLVIGTAVVGGTIWWRRRRPKKRS